MTDNFADRLIHAVHSKSSCVCVGIDPRLEQLPKAILENHPSARTDLSAAAECYREFGCRIADIVAPLVPVVKPQVAFFERLGPAGMAAYAEVCQHAREQGLLVIADIKRNDISSTAQAYAEAYLGPAKPGGFPAGIEVDAVTLNAYLGIDGIQPFLDSAAANDKGMFILVRTSNQSAKEFQDFERNGRKLYEEVAGRVTAWGESLVGECGYSSVGAVVGATYPEEAAALRKQMPRSIFLVPGYGAQGGGADDVAPCFNEDGLGAVVNASRSIIFAYNRLPEKETHGESQWESSIESATRLMNEELARFGSS